jgi:hypothetical protein
MNKIISITGNYIRIQEINSQGTEKFHNYFPISSFFTLQWGLAEFPQSDIDEKVADFNAIRNSQLAELLNEYNEVTAKINEEIKEIISEKGHVEPQTRDRYRKEQTELLLIYNDAVIEVNDKFDKEIKEVTTDITDKYYEEGDILNAVVLRNDKNTSTYKFTKSQFDNGQISLDGEPLNEIDKLVDFFTTNTSIQPNER